MSVKAACLSVLFSLNLMIAQCMLMRFDVGLVIDFEAPDAIRYYFWIGGRMSNSNPLLLHPVSYTATAGTNCR